MTAPSDTITIMSCLSPQTIATKKFTLLADGTIRKDDYNAGLLFGYEKRPVSSLHDLYGVMHHLLSQPQKFVIRGEPKQDAGASVYRRIYGENAAFDPMPRRWVMLDMDKIEVPAYFDPAKNPEAIITWLINHLPEPFRNVSCVYKFSSSQSVPAKIGEESKKTVSAHLWFWCDKPVADDEWKRYFKVHPCNVDKAVFTGVQPHFTARPLFQNMDDPLPNRCGLLKGDADTVTVPPMPAPEIRKSGSISKNPPVIKEEDRKQALTLLKSFYPRAGGRARFCGAIAATLYRAGWLPENIAEFIYELAILAHDDEPMKRHDNVHYICMAVDRGDRAQGIPTLIEEFKVDRVDEILKFLGAGKPDIRAAILKLSNTSSIDEISEAIKLLLPLTLPEREIYLDEIKKQTQKAKGVLRTILNDAFKEDRDAVSCDAAYIAAETLLHEHYEGGRLLLWWGGNFWRYNGRFWEIIAEQFLKQQLLPIINHISGDDGRVSTTLNSALNILEGLVFRDGDPLHMKGKPPHATNCTDGELWFDEEGNVTLRPHNPESGFRHCLDVRYDPTAKAPRFRQAMLEIFANSTDSEDMLRHYEEIAGYACQPWRGHAVIMMFYGGGRNGKSRGAMGTIRRLLGSAAVMDDRINHLEKYPFRMGALVDKLVIVDDDMDEGTCLADGLLKKISEEKPLTVEQKHRDPFNFICRALPFMLTNGWPVTKDLSDGMLERIMIVPFNRKFSEDERKQGLFDEIWLEESSGILNLMLAGFKRLKERGRFLEPQDCLAAKEEWLRHANVVATFIKEMCDTGDDMKQTLDDFYECLRNYCGSAGIANVPKKSTVLQRAEKMGYKVTRPQNYPVLNGLKARNSLNLKPVL